MATIVGTSGDDTLNGTAASDFISGADVLDGGAGSDALDGDGGDDVLVGGPGNDSLDGADGGDSLDGGDGNDTLAGGGATDTGADALSGGDGDDVLRQTRGADTLDGGAGFDRLEFGNTGIAYGGATGVVVNLATHVSDLNSSAAGANARLISIESVFGTAGNDVLRGGDVAHAADLLGSGTTENFRPSGGNDIVIGATGNGFLTRVDYANSTSAITVDLGTGTASDGFGGTDTLVRIDVVYGGSGNDVLNGGGRERLASGAFLEQFRGNAGNDSIDGVGTDSVLGAAGADRVNYGSSPAAVMVNLGATAYAAGEDVVAGGTARDGFGFIDTLRDIDQVSGSGFDDTLVGEADDHRLIGDAGNDTLVGRADGVEASYQSAGSVVVANLGAGTASDGQGGTDTLVGITDLRGSALADTLTGDDADNRISGEGGADAIDGGAGVDFAGYGSTPLANGGIDAFIENGAGQVDDGMGSIDTLINIEGLLGTFSSDALSGGEGDQWFGGLGGNDTIDGGAGSDWVQYTDSPAGVVVDLGTGTASDGWGGVWELGGTDTLISIENAQGSDFGDRLVGSAGGNRLRGDAGDDTLDGGAGIDTGVYGGARADYTVTRTPSGMTVEDGAGSDGIDTLANIERLQFSDTSLAFDMGVSESGGKTALLLGACLGKNGPGNMPLAGALLDYFDAGRTLLDATTLLVDAGVVAQLAGGADDRHFVDWVWRNLTETQPDAETEATLMSFIGSGLLTQATLLATAAELSINQDHIGLIGLQQDGMAFLDL
jgi:Ca2+-binding RTX toxin-like protein